MESVSSHPVKVFGIDWGHIHFKHGKHCIFVPTKCHPTVVLVSKKDHGHSACCQSPKNWLTWEMVCGGIHFCAVVESGSMEIEWAVTKSCHCCGCDENKKHECGKASECDTTILKECTGDCC